MTTKNYLCVPMAILPQVKIDCVTRGDVGEEVPSCTFVYRALIILRTKPLQNDSVTAVAAFLE